jgi:hypothetical protein
MTDDIGQRFKLNGLITQTKGTCFDRSLGQFANDFLAIFTKTAYFMKIGILGALLS